MHDVNRWNNGMKYIDPNVVSSETSSMTSLRMLMEECGITSVGKGAKLSTAQTCSLSAYLRCMSPKFLNKFLSSDADPSLTCFAAQIQQSTGEAYAYAWARKDKLSIDFDLAVLPLDSDGNPGNSISAIYEPTFEGRTTLSADTYSELERCANNFTMSQLSNMCPKLFNAFQYCEKKKWTGKQ